MVARLFVCMFCMHFPYALLLCTLCMHFPYALTKFTRVRGSVPKEVANEYVKRIFLGELGRGLDLFDGRGSLGHHGRRRDGHDARRCRLRLSRENQAFDISGIGSVPGELLSSFPNILVECERYMDPRHEYV